MAEKVLLVSLPSSLKPELRRSLEAISFCFRVIKIYLHSWVASSYSIDVHNTSRTSRHRNQIHLWWVIMIYHLSWDRVASPPFPLKTYLKFLASYSFDVMFHSSLNSFIYIFGLCFNVRIDLGFILWFHFLVGLLSPPAAAAVGWRADTDRSWLAEIELTSKAGGRSLKC